MCVQEMSDNDDDENDLSYTISVVGLPPSGCCCETAVHKSRLPLHAAAAAAAPADFWTFSDTFFGEEEEEEEETDSGKKLKLVRLRRRQI